MLHRKQEEERDGKKGRRKERRDRKQKERSVGNKIKGRHGGEEVNDRIRF